MSRSVNAVLWVAAFLLLAVSVTYADTLALDSTTTTDSFAATPDTVASAAMTETPESGRGSFYPLSPERRTALASYSSFVNVWRFAEFFIGLGILALILFTGFSAKLRDWAQAASKPFFIVWLYLVLYIVADYLLNFPFNFYRNFIVESNYGFMNQSFTGWLGEDLLGSLLTAVIGIIPVWFLYLALKRLRRWWLAFSLGAIPFMIVAIVVAPVYISPLFNDYEPLKNKQLETRILGLADKVGIEDSRVFQVNASKQSSKLNAYVTGLFGSKRIVLYDTLIDSFSEDEIAFVMGHEMGHYVMHHIWYGLALSIVLLTLSLWIIHRTMPPFIRRFKQRLGFDSMSDIASLPLILAFATVIGFVIQPISNGVTRMEERAADKFGMDVAAVSGEDAAKAFEKLSAYNLSDPNPNGLIEFWFYDHPALDKRIAFVTNYHPTGR